MDKSKKLYLKALKYYEKGYIDKAIETCEKSMAINLKNSAVINLKGLLYYFKGDLDKCRVLWKLNSHENNDSVSRKYIETLKEDEKNLKNYMIAIKNIKELHIREGLSILYECNESDFNCININNYIAFCLIRCGQYEEAECYVEKVLSLDRKNKMALERKKELEEWGVSKKDKKKIICVGMAIISAFVIGLGVMYAKNAKYKPVAKNIQQKAKQGNTTNLKKENQNEIKKNKINNLKKDELKEEKNFPNEEIKKLIVSQTIDYEKLYSYIKKWDKKVSNKDNENLIEQSKQLMKNKGTQYFYNKSHEYMKQNNYNLAKDNLTKAYEFGKENYLHQHIIYFLAKSYNKLEQNEEAMKYYKEYDQQFPKGVYEETVLYTLAVSNKDIDIKKAKQYAQKLSEQYPNSPNNNSIIKQISNS